MEEKYFKYLVVLFFGISTLMVVGGFFSTPEENYDVQVTQMVTADKGLDLKAVGEILKEAKDADSFEQLINKSGINNLDLDEDGKVDYINVTEFGDDTTKGFALSTQLASGEVQELASIKVQKEGEKQAKVELRGNEAVYGQNHYYHSTWSPGFGSGLMLGYLFSSHRPYFSPWGYGSYPGYYQSRSPIDHSSYQNRVNSMPNRNGYNRTSNTFGGAKSPYYGKNARSVKAPLINPTGSQRSFQASNPTRQKRSGGFGRAASGTSSRFGNSRSSSRSGGFGSARRGFGGGSTFRGK